MGEGCVLADIGTDHAYVPLFLLECGRIPSAIAMDVNRGPLERAKVNVRSSGYEDCIDLRLSDGFAALMPGEAKSAVIAGMGGPLTIRILKEGARTVRALDECILQPQSEVEQVRAFLLGEGFSFLEEDMVEEDGKYYPMMKVRPPAESGEHEDACAGPDDACASPDNACAGPDDARQWDRTELRYGRLLLRKRHPVLEQFLEREIRLRKDLLARLETEETSRAAARMGEIKEELECAEKGMEYYALQRNHTGDRSHIPGGCGS